MNYPASGLALHTEYYLLIYESFHIFFLRYCHSKTPSFREYETAALHPKADIKVLKRSGGENLKNAFR